MGLFSLYFFTHCLIDWQGYESYSNNPKVLFIDTPRVTSTLINASSAMEKAYSVRDKDGAIVIYRQAQNKTVELKNVSTLPPSLP
jgi:hypothetical protein